MGILGALALTACSNEDVVPEQPTGGVDESLSRYMAISIRNSNSGSRAFDEDPNAKFEDGKDFENAVSTVRFYFFDNEGNGRAVKADGKNFIDVTQGKNEDGSDIIGTVEENPESENIEKILTAVLAINTEQGDNIESLKSLVAVINGKNLPGNNEKRLVNLDELRNLDAADYSLAGVESTNTPYNSESTNVPEFIMSSSVFGSSAYNCEVEIKPTNLLSSPEDALANPVKVYVERVLAKVRMSTEWNKDFGAQIITANYNGADYEAIPIKDKKGGKLQTTIDGKQLYVIFTGWGLQTVADKSNLFKKIKDSFLPSEDVKWVWQHPTYYRSYWALNPSGLNLRNFKHSEATRGRLGSITSNGSSTTINDGDFFYCQENAGDDETTGYKNVVNLDKELTNRTQAYVGGLLVTVENGVATPADIAEWGGARYEKSSLLTAMLGAVNDQILTREEEGTETGEDGTVVTKWKYSSITLDDVELVEEENSQGVTDDSPVNTVQNGKRYLSRIQLKATANGKEYFRSDQSKYESADEVNAVLKTAGIARVWGGGTTYYFVDIKHLGKTAIDDSEYGVVRNHIYDVRINSVYGLGTPVLVPFDEEGKDEVPIKPEKPGEDESYLGVQIYILSWRIVDNSIDLEW